MQIQNKTFCLVTLGCRTNICESDIIYNQLIQNGANRVDSVKVADICIINTCCVTAKAETKSKYYINQAIRSNSCKLIVIVGCLMQINATIIQHPKIGIVLGSKYKTELVNYLKEYKIGQRITHIDNFKKDDVFEKYNLVATTNTTRAFIKIQDGCDFMCSYCIIPFVRGRQRSLPHDEIIQLIKTLIRNGYKEIVLTGVNTAGYRENDKYGFLELLRDINELDGHFRIRISSLEPFQINHEIIDLITNNTNRWCQQFHICLQSGSNRVIKAMKRKYTINDFLNLCKYIRTKNKLASITTDYIVGFPSETNNDFITSCKNLNKCNFANIHIFPFSARPFTPASKLPTLVSDYEKRQRFNKVNDIRKKLCKDYLKEFIGKKVHVLFEQPNNPHLQIGHSEYFFTVKVETDKSLVNKLLSIKITRLENLELFGELL